MRAWLVAAVIAVSSQTAFASGGAIVIPPIEVDVGASAPFDGAALIGPSTELLAGVHWASLAWKPTSVDVGFGYVGSFRHLRPGYTERATTMDDGPPSLTLQGAYADVAYAIENQPHWRTWLAARIETLHVDADQRSFNALGAALRISSEIYVAGAGGASGGGSMGLFAGALAVGVYVEAVKRDLPAELGSVGVSAGLTLRVPFILGLGC
jgi:hypothetical protein